MAVLILAAIGLESLLLAVVVILLSTVFDWFW